MDEKVEIRSYKPGDEERIIELLKLSFPDWEKRNNALDYWCWKYLSNPLGSIIQVLLKEERIVSVRHSITLKIKLGDATYLGQYGDDVATHPSVRGRGLFDMVYLKGIEASKQHGIKLVYSVPTHPATTRERKPFQKIVPHGINHLIRVKDPKMWVELKNLKNPKITTLGITLTKTLSKSMGYTYTQNIKTEVEVKDVTHFTEEVDDIWEAQREGLDLALEKKSQFLNWRYGDSRGGHYIIKQATYSGDLVGYAVAEIRGEGVSSEAYIMDLQTLPDREDVADALLDSLIVSIDNLGINATHYRTIDRHPSQKRVKSHGFITIPGQKRMILKLSFIALPLELFEVVERSTPARLQFGYGDFF